MPSRLSAALTGIVCFFFRHKTKVPVYVPLPPIVTGLLDSLPNSNPRYLFWSGNGDPHTAKKGWQRSLRLLFRDLNLTSEDGLSKRCHPHMFRDTFAVELLLAGVPLDQVSLLLGSQQHQGYGEALRAVCESPAGTARAQRAHGLEERREDRGLRPKP